MDVAVSKSGDVHVVSVRGDLDLLTTVVFFNSVVELRSRPGVKMVLDLAGLTFMDSVGTGELWKTVQTVRREGGRAILARVPPQARKTMDVVGMASEVSIAATVEDALRTLAAPPPPG